MKTRWLLTGAAVALFAMFALAADSIPHPTPATDDTLSIGNGTKWVSSAVPACSTSGTALRYDTSANAFSCGAVPKAANAFTGVCFDSECLERDGATNSFIGSAQGISGTGRAMSCSWKLAGTSGGSNSLILDVYDLTASSSACTCDLGACTGAIYVQHNCDCAVTFDPTHTYVFGVDPSTSCGTTPGQVVCNMTFTP